MMTPGMFPKLHEQSLRNPGLCLQIDCTFGKSIKIRNFISCHFEFRAFSFPLDQLRLWDQLQNFYFLDEHTPVLFLKTEHSFPPLYQNSPLQLLTLRGATGTSLVATSPATSAMHQEEIYTSLQWDDLPEEPSQRCLCSTKFPGAWRIVTVIVCIFCLSLLATSIFLGIKFVQLSATVTEQRETLTRRDREVLNFTLWTQNRALQIEYCQALVHTSVGADCKCSPCPDNWIRNGESCYRIVKDWKIWRLGQTDCLREGSSLLQIDSREELDFIVRSLPTHEGSHDYWVGVSQEGQSQRWLWQDGSSPHPDLLPKQSLQPADQACGYLRADSLFSADCNTWKYFICEKPTWRPTL